MERWRSIVSSADPCQCSSPGSIHTVSPVRIGTAGLPRVWSQPAPPVTMRSCPYGWECQIVWEPGAKVTSSTTRRDGCSGRAIDWTHAAPAITDPGASGDGEGRPVTINAVWLLRGAARARLQWRGQMLLGPARLGRARSRPEVLPRSSRQLLWRGPPQATHRRLAPVQ